MEMEEVNSIAQKFVDKENEIAPLISQFKYRLGKMTEFSRHYYFDFHITNIDDGPYTGPPMAGAPGFTISKKSKQVEIATYGRLTELRSLEDQIDEFHKWLLDFKHNGQSLDKLKSKYKLSSSLLLMIMNTIRQSDLERETAIDLLAEIEMNAISSKK